MEFIEIDNLIIGAGILGLNLGYNFKKDNKKYLILEKNNFIGGKLFENKENYFIFNWFKNFLTLLKETNIIKNDNEIINDNNLIKEYIFINYSKIFNIPRYNYNYYMNFFNFLYYLFNSYQYDKNFKFNFSISDNNLSFNELNKIYLKSFFSHNDLRYSSFDELVKLINIKNNLNSNLYILNKDIINNLLEYFSNNLNITLNI